VDLTGQILVSMPNMLDERFYKTVIYICAHSTEGSMGIIINKKIDHENYPNLLEQLGIDSSRNKKKIFFRYGGPVETGRGLVLHTDDVIQKGSLPIDKGVILTSTSEIFNDIAKGKGPNISILAIGYAGWDAGQLENEIKQNSWMTLPVDSSFIFDEKVSNKWNDAYKMMGFNPTSLSPHSGNA
tara:strand:- start:1215 stop:1766 length:552 start_codon:yes stop_codon:yes gene_type:complete